MSCLVRVSDAAALGLHAMAYLATRGTERSATRQIAGRTGVSEAHLAKVLVKLERAGLVRGTRGPGGGFALARPADAITLKDVYEAIEGPLKPVKCLLNRAICAGPCMLGDLLADVDELVTGRLTATRLSDVEMELKAARRSGKAV